MTTSAEDIQPVGIFLLRSPLLPVDAFRDWPLDVELGADSTETDWQRSIEQLGERAATLTEWPDVRTALWLASPGLLGRKNEGTDTVLARYLSRMCGRPTPFGLFAGTTIGRVGDETRMVLSSQDDYSPRYSIRPGSYRRRIEKLVRDGSSCLRVVRNNSLVSIAGRYHYVEVNADGMATQVAIEGPPLLDELLAIAGDPATVHNLANALGKLARGHTVDKCTALVMDLVRQQVLVPAEQACADLRRIDASLAQAQSIDELEKANREVTALVDAERGAMLLQATLAKPGDPVSISAELMDRIAGAVRWLNEWLAPGPDPLAGFRSAFLDRFGDERVPLAIALDPEAGIGTTIAHSDPYAGSSLLVGLDAPAETTESPATLGEEQLAMLAKRIDSASHSIEVHDDDLAHRDADLPLPNEFAVLGSVVTARAFVLFGAAGPPATILLGRHADQSADIRATAMELALEESEAHDALVAEVVYAPTARLADIQARPTLSEFEIPYLGESNLPAEQQIPLDDLVVSVENGLIKLRSVRLDKRVLPRLSSPHDFRRDTSPVYRFLGLLQSQGYRPRLRWTWGELDDRPFLPRVTYGDITLSLARWRLNEEDIRRCTEPEDATRFATINALRHERCIPRFAFLESASGRLLCDFENALSVGAFAGEMKGQSSVTLEEVYPPLDELPLSGPEGRFIHDVVIPFRRKPALVLSNMPVQSPPPRPTAAVRNAEWLYWKLYSGPATADRLLRALRPRLLALSEEWHFLRYSDPNPHLRLRVRTNSDGLRTDFVAALEAQKSAGLLWRFESANYIPETDRYGGEQGLALCEEIFHRDSVAALDVVEIGFGNEQARWLATLQGIHGLFDAFGIALPARIELLRDMQAALLPEFAAKAGAVKALVGERYRQARETIESTLDENGSAAAYSGPANELQRLGQEAALSRPVESVLSSLVHMHCNRLLRWPARHEECFLYGFLERYYRSRLARM